MTAVVFTEMTQGSSLSLDEQMVSEQLGQHDGSFTDLPFIVSELPPASSSITQTTVAPSQAQSARDEEIFVEINAELKAAGHEGGAGTRTTVHSPAPLNVILPRALIPGCPPRLLSQIQFLQLLWWEAFM